MAEQEGPVTSETLAQCLCTNPVVVRRTMGYLREAGIVTSDRGHAGGWRIHADLGTVTLRQLHEALGEPTMFAIGNRNETPECLVEQAVNAALEGTFAEAEALLLKRFSEITLADRPLTLRAACGRATELNMHYDVIIVGGSYAGMAAAPATCTSA